MQRALPYWWTSVLYGLSSAREEVDQRLNRQRGIPEQAQKIDIELVARDKYFRVLSLTDADGLDLADEMVKAGLANAYGGGMKP